MHVSDANEMSIGLDYSVFYGFLTAGIAEHHHINLEVIQPFLTPRFRLIALGQRPYKHNPLEACQAESAGISFEIR